MNFEYVLLILFVVILSIFLYFERKKLSVQGKFPFIYFCMYRTKFGLNWMDKLSKTHPKILNFLFKFGTITGFLGMIFISIQLIIVTIKVLTSETAITAVTPVLPFEAKGVFYVPFSYWIISIFIIALVHEFAHGIASRVYKIPVKSSGFAFLGILLPIVPAAFVEPDEKLMPKKKLSEKLAIFAAGPFSNVIFAILFLLITLFVFQPLHGMIAHEDGVLIGQVLPNSASLTAGLTENEILKSINNQNFNNVESFQKIMNTLKPEQEIILQPNKQAYTLKLGQHPEDSKKAYLGIMPKQNFTPTINSIAYKIFNWLFGLMFILYLLNLGIGLFNLLPLGPLDGGRMLHELLQEYMPNYSLRIFSATSAFFLFIIIFHLFKTFVG